jgi:hypothetical protein
MGLGSLKVLITLDRFIVCELWCVLMCVCVCLLQRVYCLVLYFGKLRPYRPTFSSLVVVTMVTFFFLSLCL